MSFSNVRYLNVQAIGTGYLEYYTTGSDVVAI